MEWWWVVNYSDIISEGGYVVGASKYAKPAAIKLPCHDAVKGDLKSVYSKMSHESEKMMEKAEHMAENIEDFVEDELKAFFEGVEKS